MFDEVQDGLARLHRSMPCLPRQVRAGDKSIPEDLVKGLFKNQDYLLSPPPQEKWEEEVKKSQRRMSLIVRVLVDAAWSKQKSSDLAAPWWAVSSFRLKEQLERLEQRRLGSVSPPLADSFVQSAPPKVSRWSWFKSLPAHFISLFNFRRKEPSLTMEEIIEEVEEVKRQQNYEQRSIICLPEKFFLALLDLRELGLVERACGEEADRTRVDMIVPTQKLVELLMEQCGVTREPAFPRTMPMKD